jgi:hypothetical protein
MTSSLRPLIVAAAALLAVSLTGCDSGSAPSAPATAPTAPTAPGTTSSGIVGPSVPAASPTDALGRAAQWYQGLQTQFAAIQRDTEQIAADAGKQDVSALGTHCEQLASDVVRVQAAAAAPDKRVAAAVAKAMQAYAKAAQHCLSGDFGAAADGIDSGGAALEQANSIMNNLP